MKRLKVNRRASQRIEGGHVWVYRGEMLQELEADALEEVLLCDERGRLLGSALVDAKSPVPVRLYSRKEEAFDLELLRARVAEAIRWRHAVVAQGSTGYRLIFSESDGLPGLIVDRFGRALAMQHNMRNYTVHGLDLLEILREHIGAVDAAVLEQDGVRSLLSGEVEAAAATYNLNGIEMEADLLNGPKTGAFLDQRENYLAARMWAERLCPGGRALDLYSSSGGFALHLAQAMKQVEAVDSSPGSVKTIGENAKRNEIENVRAIQADVKQFLRGLGQARRRYDCVVADPPAFAKSAHQKKEAERAYYDLNLRAMGATASSGVFVTCSCSRAVGEADLLDIIRSAAAESRRTLSILEKRGQSRDHREVIHIPETSYLKCLMFRLDT